MNKFMVKKDVYMDLLEKGYGKRDFSKLRVEIITDKNGHRRKVYKKIDANNSTRKTNSGSNNKEDVKANLYKKVVFTPKEMKAIREEAKRINYKPGMENSLIIAIKNRNDGISGSLYFKNREIWNKTGMVKDTNSDYDLIKKKIKSMNGDFGADEEDESEKDSIKNTVSNILKDFLGTDKFNIQINQSGNDVEYYITAKAEDVKNKLRNDSFHKPFDEVTRELQKKGIWVDKQDSWVNDEKNLPVSYTYTFTIKKSDVKMTKEENLNKLPEDFNSYPSDLQNDIRKLKYFTCDVTRNVISWSSGKPEVKPVTKKYAVAYLPSTSGFHNFEDFIKRGISTGGPLKYELEQLGFTGEPKVVNSIKQISPYTFKKEYDDSDKEYKFDSIIHSAVNQEYFWFDKK